MAAFRSVSPFCLLSFLAVFCGPASVWLYTGEKESKEPPSITPHCAPAKGQHPVSGMQFLLHPSTREDASCPKGCAGKQGENKVMTHPFHTGPHC